jgi:hypothetical protein
MKLRDALNLLHRIKLYEIIPFFKLAKRCNIPNTPRVQRLYRQVAISELKTVLNKLSLDDLQKVVNNVFGLIYTQITQQNKNYYIDCIAELKKKNFIKLGIKGCLNVDIFDIEYKNSEQIILFVGENHGWKGNADKIIKQIYDETNCPIDIINEGGFFSKGYSNKASDGSNVTMNRNDPCVIYGYTPKDQLLQQNPDFVKNCIVPYEGRVKKFQEDYRQTQNFSTIIRGLVNNQIELSYSQLLQDCILDFDSYLENPQKYKKKVSDVIKRIYEECTIKKYTKDEFRNHSKSYMDLMKRLTDNFDKKTLESMKEIIIQHNKVDRTSTNLIILGYLNDLPMIIRIVKLIKENKSRYILCFMGAHHSYMIRKMLEIPNLLDFKIKVSGNSNCYYDKRDLEILVKKLDCTQKTTRMQYYDKLIKSPNSTE